MSYIELINQFWQTRRRVRLTSAEADLYFCLLQECNLRDWLNPFECSNGLICATIGMSESTLIDVRNRLQQKGFIKFEAGCRKAKSPFYHILYFENTSINPSITRGITCGKNRGKTPDTPIYRSLSKDKDSKKYKQKHSSKVSLTGNDELPFESEKVSKDFIERVKFFFNEHCKGLRPVSIMTNKRIQTVNARKREYGETAVFDMLTKAGQSTFLAGQSRSGWCATFDWLFKPTNFVKVIENFYAEERTPIRNETNHDSKQRRDEEFAEHIASKMRAASQGVPPSGNTTPDF